MTRQLFALIALGLTLSSCGGEIDPLDMEDASRGQVRFYFNNTGTRQQNQFDPAVDDMLIQHIDRARVKIDFAIMGFTRQPIIDALLRAHHRGVRLRFVGDTRHIEHGTAGYGEIDRLNIPMMVGNQYSIMHNKFFVVDDRFVATGTGNITPTGYDKNVNNYVFIDSPAVARDFTAEFEQMFSGRFGAAKRAIDNGNAYQVGDTRVEVFFSPQEDAMGKILEYINSAKQSIYFIIFAFTKDQVGSALIMKHQEFTRYNRCCDPAQADDLSGDEQGLCMDMVACEPGPFVPKEVVGVVDRSQLHSNGPYHESYRLLLYGIKMRLDGGDNSFLPGDYQAGGGRLHSKTLLIDPEVEGSAKVVTGSFNWSSSATIANDETLLVLHGQRGARETKAFWDQQWERGKSFGERDNDCLGRRPRAGDVVFNEIHWDGWNGENDPSDFGGDDVSNDEFIELLNTTPCPIDMTMWVIGGDDDFVTGLYPGTVIGPYERFLLVDHNLAPYSDVVPQDTPSAFQEPDFVMNTANDPRFLRLNLHNGRFYLRLQAPWDEIIDEAGDGGPPFAGGRDGSGNNIVNRSMERVHPLRDGTSPDAWRACEADEGGEHVVEKYRGRILATPGEPNSQRPFPEDEDASFRAATP
jgi:phosphatidylserine/phosphatidylglycerophosphate/cardiolipin synthase-like enzyme